jgi:hypothetical protein
MCCRATLAPRTVTAIYCLLLLHASRMTAQTPKETLFDCGGISLSSSGKSMTYYDLGRGFRFEFPLDWLGHQVQLDEPSDNPCTPRLPCPSTISIDVLLAASDPRFYVSQDARVTGSETINGQEWAALAWPDGPRGYYAYRGGVAIEFVAMGFGTNQAPSAAALATLTRILSSFSFLDDASRLDRQLAALRVGQRMASLTITRIVPGTGGFDGTQGKIEFAGRLTLTGNVNLETSRDGGSSRYFIDSLDSGTRALIPHLTCPVEDASPPPVQVSFSNQDFAEQQFGKHSYYLATGTVVVDNFSETFYSGGVHPSISARLIAVIENKPTP